MHNALPYSEFPRAALGTPLRTLECDHPCAEVIASWPSLVFSIIRIELLLEFPLELIPCVDRIRFSPDIVILATPTNKGYIIKRGSNIIHLLGVTLDAHCCEISFESPKKIVNFPCISSPKEGRRPWCIPPRLLSCTSQP